jgi:hypothetical protein
VEGADPHAARVDRQHGGDAGEHLARRLVGEGDCEDVGGRRSPSLDEPGDARSEHPRLAAARAREDERVLVGRRDGG